MNLVDEGSTAHGTALGGAGLEECLIGPTVHWGDLCCRVVGQQVQDLLTFSFLFTSAPLTILPVAGVVPHPQSVVALSVRKEKMD